MHSCKTKARRLDCFNFDPLPTICLYYPKGTYSSGWGDEYHHVALTIGVVVTPASRERLRESRELQGAGGPSLPGKSFRDRRIRFSYTNKNISHSETRLKVVQLDLRGEISEVTTRDSHLQPQLGSLGDFHKPRASSCSSVGAAGAPIRTRATSNFRCF